MKNLRIPGLIMTAFLATAVPIAASPEALSITGYMAGRGLETRGQASWLDGGFGRLAVGAVGADESETFGLGKLNVALDYAPTNAFGVYVHGVARAEPDVAEGREAGIIEAFAYGSLRLRKSDVLRFQLGHFILPTSRENVEVTWSSPYTVTFSALNTWIGEEVRLTGLLSEYALALGAIDTLRFGVSAFGGNDSTGALLAWRGWALGDRLSAYDEIVPLPPLDSLRNGPPGDRGVFYKQLDEGTRPFGRDLDSSVGYAGYVRWHRPEKATLQWSHYDNQGNRDIYRGEYAWQTEFDIFGFEFLPRPRFTIAGEYLDGSSGMGFPPIDDELGGYVQLDMETAYLLASYRPGPFRISLRYETFEIYDRDESPRGEINDEDGEAWTAAFFWEPNSALRLGLEYLDLESTRPAALESGFDADTDARSVILELRYYLDF